MKKIMFALFGLLVLAGCSSDDEVGPASDAMYEKVSGHWFTETPLSGETDNWRTEEEGDKAAFSKVIAIFYLSNQTSKEGWWGYLYLQDDNEMVNFGGLNLDKDETGFKYIMDSDGNITPSSQLWSAMKVANIRYNSNADVITADVTYNENTLTLTFSRPTDASWERLEEYFGILLEEGIVGGYEDLDSKIKTDVDNNNATEPSRAE